MRDPNSAIPAEATPELWRRYDEWRGQRHVRFNQRHAGKLMSWRNRRAARRIVLAETVVLVVLLASAVVAFFTYAFFIPFIIAIVGAFVVQYLLRIVTGSIAETPVTALDEIQLAQRNSARSVGFIALFSLMFIPYIILIVLGTREQVHGQLVYGTGILLISLVLTGALVPTMLTAWWSDDADPEDFATYEENDHA